MLMELFMGEFMHKWVNDDFDNRDIDMHLSIVTLLYENIYLWHMGHDQQGTTIRASDKY